MSTLNTHPPRPLGENNFHQTQSTYVQNGAVINPNHNPVQSMIVAPDVGQGSALARSSRYTNKFSFKNRRSMGQRSVYASRTLNKDINLQENNNINLDSKGPTANVDQWRIDDLNRQLEQNRLSADEYSRVLDQVRAKARDSRAGWEQSRGRCVRYINALA